MGLCANFRDPSEARCCAAGVSYASVAGGGTFYQVMRLPCVPITNRKGEVASRCAKYQPQEQEHAHD